MICSKCNNEVRPDAKFCDNCGAPVLSLPPPAPIELSCLVCGEKIVPGAPFCTKCGMPSVASQTDMTLVLPKKPVPKPEGETDSGAASEFPTLQPSDEVTLGVSEEWQSTLNAGDKRSTEPTPAKLIPLGEVTEAYVPRPVVPRSVNASSEETIMVLDTPPAKPARSAEAPKPEGRRSAAVASKPHKSSRSSAERERQKRHSGKMPVKTGNNAVLIGGIAAVVIVVLAAAVAASWWFKPHRSSKPVEVPATVSAPASAPVTAVSPPAPVASPQVAQPPVQAPIVPAETAAASQPAEPPTSDLKTTSRPALIVAPSVSSGTEASQDADKAAKSEKSETAESAKPVSSAKSSRKQTKAAPKSNQEDNYLRQIHRQLDRQ
jgi:hypothetical protein